MSDKTTEKKTKLDSVDQIRNILFGEQVALIEEKISKLEKAINQSISELSKKLDETNNKLINNIGASHKQLEDDNSKLGQALSDQMDKLESLFKNKLIETESDLINQIQTGLNKLDNKASHRNELAQLFKDMADQLSD